MRMKIIPTAPQPPQRTELWYGAHSYEEAKIYEREWEEYLKESTRWYELMQKLKL